MQLLTTKTFDRLALGYKPRFKILQGGSSSSKSYSILQYLIYKALRSKKPKLVSIVAETLPALRRGVLRDFINILGDQYCENNHNKSEGIYKLGDWAFEFFGADNVSRLHGPRRDILFINECPNVKYEAFYQLEMRTADEVYLDYNPSREFWVHTDLIPSLKPHEYYFDISTYKDNQYAPKNVVTSIERRKYTADGEISEFYKVYGLGQIGSLEGVVFDNWETLDEFPPNLEWVYGQDFGFSVDPAALVKVAVKNEAIYVKELAYDTEQTNQDIIATYDKLKLVKNRDVIWADCAEPKSIAELRKPGYVVKPALKGPDSLRAGIDWIKARKLYVHPNSTNLIKELRNYVWEKDKDGKPIGTPVDAFNHCLDSIRYALSSRMVNQSVQFRKMRL